MRQLTRHLVALCVLLFFVQTDVFVRSSRVVSVPLVDDADDSIDSDAPRAVFRRDATGGPTTMAAANATMMMTTEANATTTETMLWTNEPYANNVVVIAVLCSFAGVGIVIAAFCLVYHGCIKPKRNLDKMQLLDSKSTSGENGHVNEGASSAASSHANISFKNPVTQIDTSRRYSKEESFEMSKVKHSNESKV